MVGNCKFKRGYGIGKNCMGEAALNVDGEISRKLPSFSLYMFKLKR